MPNVVAFIFFQLPLPDIYFILNLKTVTIFELAEKCSIGALHKNIVLKATVNMLVTVSPCLIPGGMHRL
jgi:hypothetical protein